VIVPGLDRVGASDTPPLLRWLNVPRSEGQLLIIAPVAATGAEAANPLYRWLGRLERDKLLLASGARAIDRAMASTVSVLRIVK
jgi:hypothetical protein